MKTLKISLLLALFVTVSSQTSKTSKIIKENHIQMEVKNYDSSKSHYDLLAHSKDRIRLPSKS